jgi:hypothetical protein
MFLNANRGQKTEPMDTDGIPAGKADEFFILIPNGTKLDVRHPLYNLLYS